MKNNGKKFEELFKKSLPKYVFCERLKDTSQAFEKSNLTQFTAKNPYDFIVFDCKKRILYTLELKSTIQKYMTYEDILKDDNQPKKIIHKHQILSLIESNKYDNVVGGFILNFKDKTGDLPERCYFFAIDDFMKFYYSSNKKSFNEVDLLMNGAVKINGEKKRVHFYWDMDSFLSKYEKNKKISKG